MKLLTMPMACLCLAQPAFAVPEYWKPDPVVVQKVDGMVARLPRFDGAGCPVPDTTEFGRFYSGFTDAGGHRMIIGQWRLMQRHGDPPSAPGDGPASLHMTPGNAMALTDAAAGIHIVSRNVMFSVDDRCQAFNVWFDADTLKLIQANWGGR